MRITEKSLRDIIRNELLKEVALRPQDVDDRGIYFEVKRGDGYIEISARSLRGARIGFLSSKESEKPCNGAWEVDGAESKIRGLGPLLYDLMMDIVYPSPLMSDRVEVSPDARRVWDYFYERRPDIEVIHLDDENCQQNSAKIWSEDHFDGDESHWSKSSLSKAYRRKSGGTPVLDELNELAIIEFI